MGKIIAIAGLKGGIGKTNTTVNLACVLKERGFRVSIIEAKVKQTHCRDWATRAKKAGYNAPTVYTLGGEEMGGAVLELAEDRDFVIIDSEGGEGYEMQTSLAMCDLALLPASPGLDDMKDLLTTIKLVKIAAASRPRNPLVFRGLMTLLPTWNSVDATQIATALERQGVQVCESRIVRRKPVNQAYVRGESVMQSNSSKSMREFCDLADECLRLMGLEEAQAAQ